MFLLSKDKFEKTEWQSRMDNQQKLKTLETQNEVKQENKTTICKQSQKGKTEMHPPKKRVRSGGV